LDGGARAAGRPARRARRGARRALRLDRGGGGRRARRGGGRVRPRARGDGRRRRDGGRARRPAPERRRVPARHRPPGTDGRARRPRPRSRPDPREPRRVRLGERAAGRRRRRRRRAPARTRALAGGARRVRRAARPARPLRRRVRIPRGQGDPRPRRPLDSTGGHMSLNGKTAVVTGASGGIGAAVARALHARGVNLALAARCGEAAERFGGIDVVVANAGVGAYGPFLELSREHLDEMLDVNLKGTIYTIRAALPHMLGGEGDVITLASEAGRRGLPLEAVYCASKFGQVGFTRALDHELRERGIRCTNVCPGGVATGFALEEGRGRPREALAGMMSAEDVAEVVVFALERPRRFRLLELALRPMTEG